MAEVLVTGATGKTGREVVRALERRGVAVRPASRSSRVRFDWQDPATWADAVGPATAAFLVRPDIEDAPERVGAFLDAVRGLEHVVLLSEIGAEHSPASAWERRVEEAVTRRAAAWTILRPSWFMQNFTDPAFFRDTIRDAGEIPLPSGGAAISFVDARDIAAVAVVALTTSGHAARAYPVTGAEALSVAEAARLMSTVRPVRHVDLPVDDALRGLDPWLATVLAGVYERVRDGTAGAVSDTVARLTGRSPRTLADFVAEHRATWRSAA